jgi:hypothetical protein
MKVLALLPEDSLELALLRGQLRAPDDSLIRCPDQATLTDHIRPESGEVAVFCRYQDRLTVKSLGAVNPKISVVLFIEESLKKRAREVMDVVSTQTFITQQNVTLGERDISSILQQIRRPHAGGLAPYLDSSSQIGSAVVNNPDSKQMAIAQVETFVEALGGETGGSRYKEYSRRISELVDELVLNAVFDANPRMRTADRSSEFSLSPDENVEIQWGFDGELFGVMVRDHFGLLLKETILRYIDETNPGDLPVIERKSGGLGFKMVLERLHQLVVRVNPCELTEIMCLMRFEKRFRDFDARLKSFHFYTL